MAIRDAFLGELEQEVSNTRKMLERVPEAEMNWKPHDKSMTLSRLATHIAEIYSWSEIVLTREEFDLAPPGSPPYQPEELTSVSEILERFDGNVAKVRELLSGTGDSAFMESWTLKKGGEKVFSAPRVGVVRSTLFNHIVHHRGQLSVYLRLLGVPLPAIYGPSADQTM